MTDPTEIPAQSRAQPRAQSTVQSTVQSTAQSTAGSLAQRYRTDRPRRRGVAIALGGLLAAALLAWAVWAMSSQGAEPIEAQVTSYDVVGTHETRVKVAAELEDAETDGTCLVRATAEDHTIVGELNLTTDQLRESRGQWIPIRTERRATTATVVRCDD